VARFFLWQFRLCFGNRRNPPFLFSKRWIARITEFEWHRYFADVQDSGPFEDPAPPPEFEAEAKEDVSGTLVRGVIEYEVGLGWLAGFCLSG
jgi:ligand-binding SRPBCC domain-containing protein